MDGKDLARNLGQRIEGKATRESLAALHRQQQAVPPGTALDCRKVPQGQVPDLWKDSAAMEAAPQPRR
ncbi:hypothetical protein [Siccirubricoccus phaeus]|uniref:hypothetical protein n=1 Tax=Siccirubricoccus phaeus TaxID=2595053 RepID=UPI0011F245E7|nr:hypothetical protein [Siccirubricoccus phaeus]